LYLAEVERSVKPVLSSVERKKDQGDERNLVLIVLYENWVQERLDEPFTKEMAGK